MSVRIITPAAPILSWEVAYKHLRLEEDDVEERDYVEGLIAAATAWIDGPSGWLGQCLGPQLIEWHGDWPMSCGRLPIGPVLEIESIATDAFGIAPATVDADGYALRPDGLLVATESADWVSDPDHRIRYWAGYGKRADASPHEWVAQPPAPVLQALLLLVGQWYRTRENVVTGTIATAVPFAVEALLAPYRVWR